MEEGIQIQEEVHDLETETDQEEIAEEETLEEDKIVYTLQV